MAIRPDMENVLDEFLYKKILLLIWKRFCKRDSWTINREIKDLRLRDKLKVSIIGITEEKGKFIQMPKELQQ